MCTQWSWQDLPGFRFALVRASIRPMRMEHNAHSEPQLGPSPAPVGQNYATYLGTVRWLPKELAPVANSNSHVASLQFNSQKKRKKRKKPDWNISGFANRVSIHVFDTPCWLHRLRATVPQRTRSMGTTWSVEKQSKRCNKMLLLEDHPH